MKILFCLRSINYDRHFECFLRAVLERGHSMHVAFDVHKKGSRGDTQLFDELGELYPRLTWGPAPAALAEADQGFRSDLRFAMDYLRFEDPRFADARAHRERARERAPAGLTALSEHGPFSTPTGRARLFRLLRTAERATPVPEEIKQFVERQAPDVVVISPLVGLGSPQGEYVRAARALGIPSALLVASWDNLTNKGIIRDAPDRTIVWNGAQVEEAVELHSLARDRTVAVGAHTYDHWFGWEPSRTREAFCEEVGLDPKRPILLYTGSSGFIAPHEPDFVREWVQALRESGDKDLSTANVLVRPHPAALKFWPEGTLTDLEDVVVWPRDGHMPNNEQAKRDYFDSIHHSAAVVGINTSALVESTIVDRPIHTVLVERYRDTQEGALHFNHLADHGPLVVSADVDEHVAALAAVLSGDDSHVRRNAQFVDTFVRPRGRNRAAAPLAVDELEEIATQPIHRVSARSSDRVVRASLQPVLKATQMALEVGRNGSSAGLDSARARSRPKSRSGDDNSLRLLFCLDHPGILIHFDTTIEELARRGHEVHLAFVRDKKHDEGFEALDKSGGRIVREPLVARRDDSYASVAYSLRATADYAHYLDPSLEEAQFSRDKWRGLAALPIPARFLYRFDHLPHRVVERILAACAALEDAIPPSEYIGNYLNEIDPDVVIVSPLIQQNSYQTDLVKTARAQGRPTLLCVASWDNLTSKGYMRVVPDRVTVWNHTQLEEAVRYQRVPESRIVVTGAQNFDRWYERKPRWSAEEFRERMGLPRDKPYLLFVGSSQLTLADDEEERFCRDWLRALRGSGDPELENISVLVRPHPRNDALWKKTDLSEFGDVRVWRRDLPLPVLEDDRAEYYDSMYHADAVIGINSSALLEAAIIGRPTHTVLLPEFADLQTRLIHFNYTLSRNGGFLQEATSLDEHVRLLAQDLRNPKRGREIQRRFVDPFIRPRGVDKPAMQFLVEAVETMRDVRIASEPRPGADSRLARAVLTVARVTSRGPVSLQKLSDNHGARAAAGLRRVGHSIGDADDSAPATPQNRAARSLGRTADWLARHSLVSRNRLKLRGEPIRRKKEKEISAIKGSRDKPAKAAKQKAARPTKPKGVEAAKAKVKQPKAKKQKVKQAKVAKPRTKQPGSEKPKAAEPKKGKPAKATPKQPTPKQPKAPTGKPDSGAKRTTQPVELER